MSIEIRPSFRKMKHLPDSPSDFPGLRIVIKDLEKKTTVQYRSANCLISDFEVDPDITLKDSNDEQVDITLLTTVFRHVLFIIKICKFSASMCEHDEQSSVQGKVECFHVPSQKMTVIINDPGKTFTQCMEELYAVLTRKRVVDPSAKRFTLNFSRCGNFV